MMSKRALMATALGVATFGSSAANAAYTVTFTETATGVMAVGVGTLNINGLSALGNFQDTPFISPGRNIALIGGSNETFYQTTLSYTGILGTSGALLYATSGTGGLVGALGGQNLLAVPQGYVSNSGFFVSSFFAGQTIASLSLLPGRVDVRFNSGANVDTLTFQINAPVPPVVVPTPGVPEPATWAMMTLGFGAMGFAMRRKKAATRIRFA